jgi:hypothetical protein
MKKSRGLQTASGAADVAEPELSDKSLTHTARKSDGAGQRRFTLRRRPAALLTDSAVNLCGAAKISLDPRGECGLCRTRKHPPDEQMRGDQGIICAALP